MCLFENYIQKLHSGAKPKWNETKTINIRIWTKVDMADLPFHVNIVI